MGRGVGERVELYSRARWDAIDPARRLIPFTTGFLLYRADCL